MIARLSRNWSLIILSFGFALLGFSICGFILKLLGVEERIVISLIFGIFVGFCAYVGLQNIDLPENTSIKIQRAKLREPYLATINQMISQIQRRSDEIINLASCDDIQIYLNDGYISGEHVRRIRSKDPSIDLNEAILIELGADYSANPRLRQLKQNDKELQEMGRQLRLSLNNIGDAKLQYDIDKYLDMIDVLNDGQLYKLLIEKNPLSLQDEHISKVRDEHIKRNREFDRAMHIMYTRISKRIEQLRMGEELY
jgi:hypothetical protein